MIAALCFLNSSEAARDISSKGEVSSGDFRIEKKRGAPDASSKALAHYTMGIIYDNENRTDEAIREYTAALALEPNISYLHSRLGVDFFLAKDIDKAAREFSAAKSLDPKDTKARFLLALAYTALNKFDLAQKEYEDVVRIDPNDITVLGSLADLFVVQEKMADAVEIYEKLIEKEKDSSLLYFNLALVRFHMGAYYDKIKERPIAVSEFREAIKLDPKFSDAYNYLGYMYAEEGSNLDEAEVLIKKAIELEPNNGAYIDSLGWAYFQGGKFNEALIELQKAVKLEPDDLEIKEHFKRAKEKLKKNNLSRPGLGK